MAVSESHGAAMLIPPSEAFRLGRAITPRIVLPITFGGDLNKTGSAGNAWNN
jgi:hypothetical protein